MNETRRSRRSILDDLGLAVRAGDLTAAGGSTIEQIVSISGEVRRLDLRSGSCVVEDVGSSAGLASQDRARRRAPAVADVSV